MWDTKPERFILYTHNPSQTPSHSPLPAPVTYTELSGNGSINYSQQVACTTSSVTSSPWTDSATWTPPSVLGESCWACAVPFWRNRHLWCSFFVFKLESSCLTYAASDLKSALQEILFLTRFSYFPVKTSKNPWNKIDLEAALHKIFTRVFWETVFILNKVLSYFPLKISKNS